MIDKPGVYDLPVNDYHADPVKGGSLSSTGARKLLPPSCPAKYRQWVDDPVDETSAVFDFGHAAHRTVLGAGAKLAIVDAPDWRSKAAREQRDEARGRGEAPVLPHEAEQVLAMGYAITDHPIASTLFDNRYGNPEQTLIWQDETTGVWCRALLDWLPHPVDGQRLIVTDYKSARSAEPAAFGRAAASYGYHVQAAFYLAGVRALGLDLDDPAAFLFVAQEKVRPYLVSLVELDGDALDLGDRLVRRALNTYAACVSSGTWPAYAEHVVQVSLPNWVDYAYGEAMA